MIYYCNPFTMDLNNNVRGGGLLKEIKLIECGSIMKFLIGGEYKSC